MNKNKLIAAVMAFSLVGGNSIAPLTAFYANAADTMFGDINGDDIIDGRDATMLLTYYAKTSTGYTDSLEKFVSDQSGVEVKPAAGTLFGDINGDNIIDGRDATMLLTYYAKTSTGYTGTLEQFVADQNNPSPSTTTTTTAPAATTTTAPVTTTTVTEPPTPTVTKGFAIKAYAEAGTKYDSMGSAVTVSAKDIAAGDVVVPIAVYINEETPDSQAISVAVKVESDNADVSKITFKDINPATDYFAEAKTFNVGGQECSTKRAVTFAGKKSITGAFTPAGTYQIASDTSQTVATADNAYIGCSWTCNGAEYKFTGEKSTDHPFFIFDVTLPKGTAAGDYSLRFCKYNTDLSGEHYNPTPMIETDNRFVEMLGNLKLEEMTIKVEGPAAE